jgi:hypothetical protein
VAIDLKLYPQKTFVLTPLQAGSLRRDSGTISHNFLSIPGRDVMRDGQKVTIYDGGVATLTGRLGTLTIRDRNEWVHLERDGNGDGELDAIAIGTWNVVRGTGQYAGIAGKGRTGHIGLGSPWYARYEGFLNSLKCAEPDGAVREGSPLRLGVLHGRLPCSRSSIRS